MNRDQRPGCARLLTLPPDEFPHLIEATPHVCEIADPDPAFEFALDLLDGDLQTLLERRSTTTTER